MAKILATGAARAREQDRIDAEKWRRFNEVLVRFGKECVAASAKFNAILASVPQRKPQRKRLTSAEK